MPQSKSPDRRRHWEVVVIIIVVACLIVDLLPHRGPPDFRYTGSDPAYAVWDLGWPLALFIYDPRSGLQVGPMAYVVLPFQLLLVAVTLVVTRRAKNTSSSKA